MLDRLTPAIDVHLRQNWLLRLGFSLWTCLLILCRAMDLGKCRMVGVLWAAVLRPRQEIFLVPVLFGRLVHRLRTPVQGLSDLGDDEMVAA